MSHTYRTVLTKAQLYRFFRTLNEYDRKCHAHHLSFGRCKVSWSVLMLLCVCLLSNTHCETVLILGNSHVWSVCTVVGGCIYCTHTYPRPPVNVTVKSLLLFSAYMTPGLIVPCVLVSVFTSHTYKYNLLDLHFFTSNF